MAEPSEEHTILRTPRLTLRAAEPDDLDDFFSMYSDKEVMKYWNCAPLTRPEQAKVKLDAMIDCSTNGVLDFVMVHHPPDQSSSDKGRVIGKVGIWSYEKQEIGYMLHRDFWRRGYMAEAMTALFPLCWTKGLTNVVADVDPRNEGSIKILEKFGFRETGRESRTGKIDGVWYDSVYLGLERPKDADVE